MESKILACEKKKADHFGCCDRKIEAKNPESKPLK
jgi:hypothetical protein